jgi:hypothetical protein
MNLLQATQAVHGTCAQAEEALATRLIQRIVASDLMSDVLVVHDDDILLVTSLVSDQVVRTADLIGAAGIIIVNGKQIPNSTHALGKELDIPLISSPLDKYSACVALARAGAPVHGNSTP